MCGPGAPQMRLPAAGAAVVRDTCECGGQWLLSLRRDSCPLVAQYGAHRGISKCCAPRAGPPRGVACRCPRRQHQCPVATPVCQHCHEAPPQLQRDRPMQGMHPRAPVPQRRCQSLRPAGRSTWAAQRLGHVRKTAAAACCQPATPLLPGTACPPAAEGAAAKCGAGVSVQCCSCLDRDSVQAHLRHAHELAAAVVQFAADIHVGGWECKCGRLRPTWCACRSQGCLAMRCASSRAAACCARDGSPGAPC
jgi:hypothetical protein